MSIDKEMRDMMRKHYQACFQKNGATAAGVDWKDQRTSDIRYQRMLDVLEQDSTGVPTILDVGCGYGGILGYGKSKGIEINYIGIDLVPEMIAAAKANFSGHKFICGDILTTEITDKVDYVVCNGILTQKLTASISEMDAYAKALIGRMYGLARRGIAFNVMSTFVNFMVPNLYYKSPIEMIAYCMSNHSKNLRLDHSYGLYEYTLYVYRDR